jgi:hypothetical protein
MVKALCKDAAGGLVLILGLSAENVRRLEARMPIVVENLLEELALAPDTLPIGTTLPRIVVCYGETERAIEHELRTAIERRSPIGWPIES